MRQTIIGAALAGLLGAGPAAAQTISYEFANAATGAAQSSFTVDAGASLPVRVYLREGGGAATLNSQGGLATAAVRLSYNNPAGFVTIQNVSTDVTAAVPPWAAGTTTEPLTPPPANSAVLNVLGPFSGGVLPDAAGRVFLGTFTLRGVAAGSTTLSLSDPNPGNLNNTTLFTNGAGIDALIASGTATVTVTTPIPEPAGLLAAAAGALALARRRR